MNLSYLETTKLCYFITSQNTRFSPSHKDLLGADDEEENSQGI